jgi:4-amino-4-deoxy-L-arabinose transferase-like glycosyltransferase
LTIGAAASFLVLVTWLLFFFRLGDRDLWSSHEGRAAQDAQAILDDGNWGLPHLFDRHLELQKPPLYYWLVAIAAKAMGGKVDAWTVRLPATISGVAGVVGLFALLCGFGRPIAGLAGAVVLATAVHYTWLARIGRIDMPLTLSTGAALSGYFLAYRQMIEGRGGTRWPWLLVFYVGSAAAVMLKGPIGVLLVGTVVALHLAIEGRLSWPWRPQPWLALCKDLGVWWGLPVFLALAAPWFVWAGIKTHGSLVQTFFLHHNFERAFGGTGGLRAHPWWFYLPRLAADFFPWSPVLAVVIVLFAARKSQRSDPVIRFGMIWLAAMVLLLSCARFKRADYLLPAYPGAALAVGCTIEGWYRSSRRRRWMAAALTLIVAGTAVGWWVFLERVMPAQEPAREEARFAGEIRKLAPRPELVIFFRAEDHALAFHVGSPIDTVLEWENLNVWAGLPGCHYIVMPLECAREWATHINLGKLEPVLNCQDLPGAAEHERPLVLLRTRPLK